MVAKTVGFAIAEEDRARLDELVNHFGNGNRSEFLRVAMDHFRREMWAQKLQGLQAEARDALSGRVVEPEEVAAHVKALLRERA